MLHIHRFVERLQGAEARGLKDFIMPVKDAKDLHADITKLLLSLQQSKENPVTPTENTAVRVEINGGSF